MKKFCTYITKNITIKYILMTIVHYINLVLVIVVSLWIAATYTNNNGSRYSGVYHRKYNLTDKPLDKGKKGMLGVRCPKVFPSYNYRPDFLDKQSMCQVSNVGVAQEGTIGQPAYTDVNEFPAKYKQGQEIYNDKFHVQPNDNYEYSEKKVDFVTSGPKCNKDYCVVRGGIGKPFDPEEEDYQML
jgi:hypothetical protein